MHSLSCFYHLVREVTCAHSVNLHWNVITPEPVKANELESVFLLRCALAVVYSVGLDKDTTTPIYLSGLIQS